MFFFLTKYLALVYVLINCLLLKKNRERKKYLIFFSVFPDKCLQEFSAFYRFKKITQKMHTEQILYIKSKKKKNVQYANLYDKKRESFVYSLNVRQIKFSVSFSVRLKTWNSSFLTFIQPFLFNYFKSANTSLYCCLISKHFKDDTLFKHLNLICVDLEQRSAMIQTHIPCRRVPYFYCFVP